MSGARAAADAVAARKRDPIRGDTWAVGKGDDVMRLWRTSATQREQRQHGSARGAAGNLCPYRDPQELGIVGALAAALSQPTPQG